MRILTLQGKDNLARVFTSKEGDPFEVDPKDWQTGPLGRDVGRVLSGALYNNETLEGVENDLNKAINMLQDMKNRLMVFALKNETGNFE